jgi:NIPSNAP protein
MTTQLRIYRIREGKLDEFVEAWRTHVRPLRERMGFVVEGAWVDRERERFVWMVSYLGPEGFEQRNADYYASPERSAIQPDPAELILEADTGFVEPVS